MRFLRHYIAVFLRHSCVCVLGYFVVVNVGRACVRPILWRSNVFSVAMLNFFKNGAFSTTNSMIYCEFYNFYCEFYKKLVWC